jgi:sigma-B regulation protein RsbU (phosphoserine phosphatase)
VSTAVIVETFRPDSVAGRPTILIVDDSAINSDLVNDLLSSEGFVTHVAQDGASARAMARSCRPDLILLDVMMPGESGFDTCSLLKSDPATADIPIIFLSALDDVKSKVKGLKIGGVDYIPKPVNGEEVLARVRVHLRIGENNRRTAELYRSQLRELRDAQQAILTRPEECPGAGFAVHYAPLNEAGGDFYDVVAVDSEVIGYFVADVSGHGVNAAFLTSAIKALLRQYSGPVFSPEDTMRGVDSVMRQILGEEQYLTACYARLNLRTHRLSVVSAGHPPLVLVGLNGASMPIEMDGDPLGMFSSLVLQRKDLNVRRGDRFFLYTDGLIEAYPGELRAAGLDRLQQACSRHAGDSLSETVSAIAGDLWRGITQIDDVLLLGVEVK